MEWGLAIGLFAAAIAAILPGMGSAKAVGLAGGTAGGGFPRKPGGPPPRAPFLALSPHNGGFLVCYTFRGFWGNWHLWGRGCGCAGG